MSATVALRNVFLHVTKACNLRCRYCYFSADRPLSDELTTSELAGLWRDLVAVAPQKLVLTGGEPLLRPDLCELLEELRAADREHAVLRCLNTNGHLVTGALARRLVGLVDEVRVSIDALEARNDAQRGKGNFAAALAALETLHGLGFEPKALVTVTAAGLPDLESLVQLLLARNIRRINLNPFRPVGRGVGNETWSPDGAALRALAARLGGKGTHIETEEEAPRSCGVGRFLNIMPNGDVFPCHVLTAPEFRCGNVRHERLVEICRRGGLLGQLADLDFRTIDVPALRRPGVCLGEVYAMQRSDLANVIAAVRKRAS